MHEQTKKINDLISGLEAAHYQLHYLYRSCSGYADGVNALRAFMLGEKPWEANKYEDDHFNDLGEEIQIQKALIAVLEATLRQAFEADTSPTHFVVDGDIFDFTTLGTSDG